MRHKRTALSNFFDDKEHPFFHAVNNILALTTIISIISIVLETVSSLEIYHQSFKAVEYVTTAIFTLEYIARLYFASSKSHYIFSFFGVIDLLAIIPTYLGIGNLTFLKSVRSLRILRFLRMTRLAKLAEQTDATMNKDSIYALNIEIYLMALFSSLLVIGTGVFFFEGGQEFAKDIPSGMYWAFKVILGGLPFQQPESLPGTIILILARFVSLILLGLVLNIMSTIMKKVLIGSEADTK